MAMWESPETADIKRRGRRRREFFIKLNRDKLFHSQKLSIARSLNCKNIIIMCKKLDIAFMILMLNYTLFIVMTHFFPP